MSFESRVGRVARADRTLQGNIIGFSGDAITYWFDKSVEGYAQKGEVVLDAKSTKALGKAIKATEWRKDQNGRFVVVEKIKCSIQDDGASWTEQRYFYTMFFS